MPSVDIYGLRMSPLCRMTVMTAKAVGLDVNWVEVNPTKGETKTPAFMAMNPQHCVPTLKDGDFVLWESRVISSYLASQYGEGKNFIPKGNKKRAQVERLIHFDMGTLWQRFSNYAMPVAFKGETPDPEKLASFHEALAMLEQELEGHKFAVGDTATIADHCLVVNASSFYAAGFDFSKYKNIRAWIARCKQWPYYNEAQEGVEDFGAFFKSKLNQ